MAIFNGAQPISPCLDERAIVADGTQADVLPTQRIRVVALNRCAFGRSIARRDINERRRARVGIADPPERAVTTGERAKRRNVW